MSRPIHPCSFLLHIKNGAEQITFKSPICSSSCFIARFFFTNTNNDERRESYFCSQLPTSEGVNHCPDGCHASDIEALITDYFNEGPSDDESDDEGDHRNEDKNCK